jgi:hypothetical protein
MNVDISLGQLLTSCLLGMIAWISKGTRSEITNLRADIKEERNARGVIEARISAMEARCKERHE